MKDKLRELLKNETGDTIADTTIGIKSWVVKSREDVWNSAQGFAFDEGWLCVPDCVVPLYSKADFENIQGKIILFGELAGKNESLHIRQVEDGWQLIKFQAGTGEKCLVLRESFLSTEEKNALYLNYDVYWKSEESVFEPYAFRFAGFYREEGPQ